MRTSMRFFGISQHISGMADVRSVLASLDPRHTLDDLTLSSHHWVMGRPKDRAPLVDGETWRATIDGRQWDRFHAVWRRRLDAYDAFICFYPPVFAYLYQCFDKPILCQVPIRYEYPYESDAERWTAFNAYLRGGVDSGRIRLCANNPYDAAYTALFVDRPVPFVPSLCEYTGVRWRFEPGPIVYYSTRRIDELEGPAFVHQARALPRGHAWKDVADARAIAHFPYNVSTMSIAEQYMMGVPLLVPAFDYALSLYARGAPLFQQNSWAATLGRRPGSAVVPAGGFPHGHDPNDYASLEAMRHWLRYTDYYDAASMPGLTYFSSLDELHALAREGRPFFEAASDRLRAHQATRRERALDGWRALLDGIA